MILIKALYFTSRVIFFASFFAALLSTALGSMLVTATKRADAAFGGGIAITNGDVLFFVIQILLSASVLLMLIGLKKTAYGAGLVAVALSGINTALGAAIISNATQQAQATLTYFGLIFGAIMYLVMIFSKRKIDRLEKEDD